MSHASMLKARRQHQKTRNFSMAQPSRPNGWRKQALAGPAVKKEKVKKEKVKKERVKKEKVETEKVTKKTGAGTAKKDRA